MRNICPLPVYRTWVTGLYPATVFIQPSIEASMRKIGPCSFYASHPVCLSDQIKSQLRAFVLPGEWQQQGLTPILGTRQAPITSDEWAGKAETEVSGSAMRQRGSLLTWENHFQVD